MRVSWRGTTRRCTRRGTSYFSTSFSAAVFSFREGSSPRAVSSIAVPQYLGTFAAGLNLTVEPRGVFGPRGFGAFTVYEASRRRAVRAVVLAR
jgi:hypothetical protein